eukprot:TRINITY_DN3145_c0_g3_i2.p1 TRINITY_DN3145_c0_g3~~TRINITY_DN3145_c0_g3_i2.p1  ORF type:complete len:278 (-),score=45.26 TRINITY_DN3145_c0_g3_i2:105-866(-)
MFIDCPAEHRLIAFLKKLEVYSILGETEDESQLQFRTPQIAECNRQTLERAYYGLFTQSGASAFESEYRNLLNHAKNKEAFGLLKIPSEELYTQTGIIKLCASFAFDNRNEPYLKDGLVFVYKGGNYTFGYNELMLQWKDSLTTCYYESLLKFPMVAYLFYNKEQKLVTHDGYIVEDVEGLKVNYTYAFSYEEIYVNEPYVVLENLKVCQSSPRLVWSSISDLLFKVVARDNLIPYQMLEQKLAMQEMASAKQ